MVEMLDVCQSLLGHFYRAEEHLLIGHVGGFSGDIKGSAKGYIS